MKLSSFVVIYAQAGNELQAESLDRSRSLCPVVEGVYALLSRVLISRLRGDDYLAELFSLLLSI
jgi:hypothetical protein